MTQDVHWTGDVDGYIGELVVREDHQGRRVGTRLVRQAEEWASARSLRRIRLATGAANTAALSLYDALGYEREDVTLSRSLSDRRADQ